MKSRNKPSPIHTHHQHTNEQLGLQLAAITSHPYVLAHKDAGAAMMQSRESVALTLFLENGCDRTLGTPDQMS